MIRDRRTFLKVSLTTAAAGTIPGLFSPSLWAKTGVPGRPLPTERNFELTTLGRLAFGPSTEDLARVGKFDLESYLEHQLHPEAIVDFECGKRLAQANLSTLDKPLKKLWADHRVKPEEMKEDRKEPSPALSEQVRAGAFKGGDAPKISAPPEKADEQRLRQLPAKETEIATWLRAVHSKRQLQEVLVDFWHNHFNVFAWDNQIAPVFVHYDRDVIRKHALGNFREMLEAVTKSPAMLFYLDNFVNQSGNPNENFARELFELHTLGAENYFGTRDRKSMAGFASGQPVGYVDGDVYEAARCFTGWRVDANQKEAGNSGEFSYYDTWHDRFQKIVLGHALPEYQPPMKDGADVLDLLAAHPGTARFLARKLCRRFVSDDPSPELLQATAKIFRDTRKAPDQIRQVVRFIVSSADFKQVRRHKLKRPFEAVAGMLRATGADFFPSDEFLNQYQRGGQKLFAWRSPDGYPDLHERWGGTTSMLERWRMANQLLMGRISGVDVLVLKPEGEAGRDPEASACHWSEKLLGAKLAPARLQAVTDFLRKEGGPANEARLRGAIALVLMSPEFQWR